MLSYEEKWWKKYSNIEKAKLKWTNEMDTIEESIRARASIKKMLEMKEEKR